jgi:spermidine synthase
MNQTSIQTIGSYRVIYRGSTDSGITVAEDGSLRNLYLDGDVLQSCMQLADPNTLHLEYSQVMMCALLFQPAPRKVLLVGLGGGSLAKFLLEYSPGAEIDAAEINPEVVRVARQYFLLPESGHLRITTAPGEEVVADRLAAGSSYDLIFVDAFDDRGPARALLKDDFLRRCRALLASNGVFTMNFWNRPIDNFPAILDKMAGLFDRRIHQLPLANANSNAIVFGFNERPPAANLMELKPASHELARRTGINFPRWLRQLYWQNI